MNRKDAEKIIKDERLLHYNWFGDHKLRESEVEIKLEYNQWIVFTTDERASIVTGSVAKYDDEEKALDNFIKRIRT